MTDWSGNLIASGGMIPTMHRVCGVCGWSEWGHTEDAMDRSYAKHLNSERHAVAEIAAKECAARIERYRLEDASFQEGSSRATDH